MQKGVDLKDDFSEVAHGSLPMGTRLSDHRCSPHRIAANGRRGLQESTRTHKGVLG